MLDYIPEHLDFNVEFEPTKVEDKKYVINGDTGKYIGIVGDGFTCASHGDFFRKVIKATTETLGEEETQGATINWRSAHKDGWAMMDVTLPKVTTKITTDKHETTLMKRIIALHGVNGTCSNTVLFGAIDFFCTNGMVQGDHAKTVRKNTSNFDLDIYIESLKKAKEGFEKTTESLQRWANTSLVTTNVKEELEKMLPSKSKAEKMYTLYNQEVSTRGRNLWSLYSAFTNYATYADERNGFLQRNTGSDTQPKSLFMREVEVAGWVDSPVFKSLEVAA